MSHFGGHDIHMESLSSHRPKFSSSQQLLTISHLLPAQILANQASSLNKHIWKTLKAVANEETLLRKQIFPRLPERAVKQCFASLLRKWRNILWETNAANTWYYARAMQNKPWNLVNIVSSASKQGNICCGRKMFLKELRNIFWCHPQQTVKHLRPQKCFLVCHGSRIRVLRI